MTKLPDKASELIRLAVNDLIAVEANPTYRIDMGTWHSGWSYTQPCLVCFAGAVMANTCKVHTSSVVYPDNFDRDTSSKLSALDFFRVGDIQGGLKAMKQLCSSFSEERNSLTMVSDGTWPVG